MELDNGKKRKQTGRCIRPSSMERPKVVFSNVTYRIQFGFEVALKENDFMSCCVIKLIGGTKMRRNRRRLLTIEDTETSGDNDQSNTSQDAQEFAPEEDKDVLIVPVARAELSSTKKLLNLYLGKSENRQGASMKFEVVDYSAFQAQDNVNFYLQDLYFEIENVNIYQSGNEETMNNLFKGIGDILRFIMLICLKS